METHQIPKEGDEIMDFNLMDTPNEYKGSFGVWGLICPIEF